MFRDIFVIHCRGRKKDLEHTIWQPFGGVVSFLGVHPSPPQKNARNKHWIPDAMDCITARCVAAPCGAAQCCMCDASDWKFQLSNGFCPFVGVKCAQRVRRAVPGVVLRPERIQFRLCVVAYRCRIGTAPSDPAETLHSTADVGSRRRLRSRVFQFGQKKFD